MESLWWNRPAVRRRMSDAQAEASQLFAFNQGATGALALGGAILGV